MNGRVDSDLRALVAVRIANPLNSEFIEFEAWVDTAFNGSLVIPQSIADELRISKQSSAEAILADGTAVQLETYGCAIEWFGTQYETQVMTNDGPFGLLGTMLLNARQVTINYREGTVEIN